MNSSRGKEKVWE